MHRRRRRSRDHHDDRYESYGSYGGDRDDWFGDNRGHDGVHPEVDRFISHMNDYVSDWRSRHGYARHVGDPGPGPNRHRLTRNTREGKVAGVCAGIADYFGFRRKHVRLAAILAAIFFFPFIFFAYAAAALLMPRGEPIAARYGSRDEERFWRNYSMRPRVTYSELRHRFRALDARVADMERAVTSSDYALHKEFRDLERGA
jgi:phage shock protein C